jgi:hypothetical protein
MTGTSNHSLIVTRKQETEKDPKVLPVSFRQIENWANSGKWQPLTLATAWSAFSTTFRPPQFYVDPFGFINVRGVIKNSNALPANTQVTFATFPSSYAPQNFNETGALYCGVNLPTVAQWIIPAGTNTLQIVCASNLAANEDIVLPYFRWAPFN